MPHTLPLQHLFPLIHATNLIRKIQSGIFPRFSQGSRGLALVALIFALFTMPVAFCAQNSMILAWDANPESDISGYRVHLGTTSGEYSIVQDVGNRTSFDLSELSPVGTYYCAVQAYNSSGLMSELSVEISFTHYRTTGLFNSWVSQTGLSEVGSAPEAIPFSDGVPNLLKYAFNMDGERADRTVMAKETGTAGLPHVSVERTGFETMFRVEYLRRKGGELGYVPKISTDLVNFVPMTEIPTVAEIDANWERVTVRKAVDTALVPRLFAIVQVERLQTPASLYGMWAESLGLNESDRGANARPHGDGVPNVLKYAFNMDGTGPDRRVLPVGTGTSGLPNFQFEAGASPPVFKVEYLRRKNSGLIYIPEISTDLVSFSPMTGNAVITGIDESWERVTIRKTINVSVAPRLFGRVMVAIP